MELKHLIDQIEKVSQSYSKKFHIHRESNWFMLKLQEEVGELTQSYLAMSGRGRIKNKKPAQLKDEFEQELADVFCHVLLLAKSNTVDIEKAVEKKWFKWNK